LLFSFAAKTARQGLREPQPNNLTVVFCVAILSFRRRQGEENENFIKICRKRRKRRRHETCSPRRRIFNKAS